MTAINSDVLQFKGTKTLNPIPGWVDMPRLGPQIGTLKDTMDIPWPEAKVLTKVPFPTQTFPSEVQMPAWNPIMDQGV